jgi:hypothetical protein
VYIRSGAGVGHGKDTGASVLQLEVLILELLAVDGLSTSALWTVRLVSGEVTTLEHEVLDDTVEGGALEVEGLAGLADTLLASAEGAEVLCGLRR